METLTLINLIANSTIVASLLAVIIRIFGDKDNPIWENSAAAWVSKMGLSLTIVGCVGSILTFSTPPLTEVLLNIGLGLTFCWLTWFHIDTSLPNTKKSKKPTRSHNYPKPGNGKRS